MSSDKIKTFLGGSLKAWILDSFKNEDFDAAAESFGKFFDKKAVQDFMSAFARLSDKFDFDEEHEEAIFKALLHAHYLHMGQWRKFEDRPYISHILRVSTYFIELLSEHTKTIKKLRVSEVKNALLACLLHDSVEDQAYKLHQNATRDEALAALESKYGEQVRHYLNCLSKPELDNDDEKTEKYKEWIKGVWESGDVLLIMIKFSDIYDNLRSSIDTFKSHDPSSLFSELDAEQIDVIDRAEGWISKYKEALLMLQDLTSNVSFANRAHAHILQDMQKRAKSILDEVEQTLIIPNNK